MSTLAAYTTPLAAGSTRLSAAGPYAASTAPPAYDPAAQAFITRAGLTDAGQKNALNTLALDFRAAGFFAAGKAYAWWPGVGGTATTHALNLFNPDAFGLVFPAGFVHDAGGFRSTTGSIADTGFVGQRDLVGETLAMAFYSRTDSGDNWDMGVVDNQTTVQGLIIKRAGGLSGSDIGNDDTFAGHTETDGRGFFVGSRTSATANAMYKNGVLVASSSGTTPTPLGRSPMAYGLCGATGATGAPSAKQCAGAGLFAGLAAGEVQALYAAVQKFNTALGRQV